MTLHVNKIIGHNSAFMTMLQKEPTNFQGANSKIGVTILQGRQGSVGH